MRPRALLVVLLVALAASGCGRKRQKGASYNADRVAASGSGVCAAMRDGTLRCWGDVPGVTGRGVPEVVDPGPGVKEACVGRGFACDVSGGAVRCARAGAFEPIAGVAGVTALSCERSRACAIDGAGKVACWAMTDGPRAAEGVAGIEGATALGSGGDATCAVVTGGALRCFGDNRDGVLGDGTTEPRAGVVTAKIEGAVRVAIGARHACARRADETVWCWGRNDQGQLGDGGRTDRFTPAPTSNLAGVDDVSAGDAHACARMKDSTVRCWGDAAHHQVGRSTSTEDVLVAALVPGLYEATAVACGGAFSCARMKDGWLRCWGANEAGQLGEGSDMERAVPVPIRYPAIAP